MKQMHAISDIETPFDGEFLLTGRAVAKALNMSPRAFQRMTESGDGPPYFRFGKKLKRYQPSIVRAWAASRVEITLTKPQAKSEPP